MLKKIKRGVTCYIDGYNIIRMRKLDRSYERAVYTSPQCGIQRRTVFDEVCLVLQQLLTYSFFIPLPALPDQEARFTIPS